MYTHTPKMDMDSTDHGQPSLYPTGAHPDWLQDLVERMRGLRVLVIGDPIIDEYMCYEDSGRTNPEQPSAPVLINSPAGKMKRRNGGARAVKTMAEALTGEFVGLLSFHEADNPQKTRIGVGSLDGAGPFRCLCRIDTPPNKIPNDNDRIVLAEEVRRLLTISRYDAVIVSDYGYGAVCPEVLQVIGERNKGTNRQTLVVIDPRRTADRKTLLEYELARPDALTPNADEYKRMNDDRGIPCYPCPVYLTLGDRGVSYTPPGPHTAGYRALPPFPRAKPADVCGAGDQFAATLALALAAGAKYEAAIDLAQLAAGLQVDRVGAVPVTRVELLAEINRLPRPKEPETTAPTPATVTTAPAAGSADRPGIIEYGSAIDIIRSWQSNGHSFAIANGCFDLLHPGHLTVLEGAKKLANRLLVLVNSDRSVKALKGSGRPILGEQYRAELLAALACVDAVVGTSDPEAAIRHLQPDFVVKGSDSGEWCEYMAGIVEKWGGTVVTIPTVNSPHTTDLIKKAKATA